MFKVKICGVKDPETAAFCCKVGADAIGLNFFHKSRRYVDEEQARRVIQGMPEGVTKVGLFVNHNASLIIQRVSDLGLDAIQLHGDETVDVLSHLNELPDNIRVIRAVRIGSKNETDALREIEEWSSVPASSRVGAILVDPLVEQVYGGTGKQIDWDWLASRQLPTDKPLILAGGLNRENVAKAISIVRPAGVDVAGGVEDDNGHKDRDKIRDFVSAALGSIERT